MAKEAALRKDVEEEYGRETIDSERRAEADNYQFPPVPANDNDSQYSTGNTNIKNVRTTRSARPTTTPKRKPKKTPTPTIKKESRNIVLAWRNFALVAGLTSLVYPLQIWCGIVCLVGFSALAGVESDWLLSTIDFGTFGKLSEAGGGLFIAGGAAAFLCGFVSFLGATVIFTSVNRSILHDESLLILTLCLVGLLLPVINLFPVMLFWYWYVAFAK